MKEKSHTDATAPPVRPPDMPPIDARQVLVDHFLRLREGEAQTLEELCAEHPALAEDLRQLHRKLGQPTSVKSAFFDRLRTELGTASTPDLLQDVEGQDADLEETVLIERIAKMSTEERYTIKGEVGRGGMGLIYKVWDCDLRRMLAMKVVLGKDGSAEEGSGGAVGRERLARFLDEAQITGQLDHPGIVPVHEMGLDANGRVFFTMRLVRGRELREIIDEIEDKQSIHHLTRTVQVMLKVCEAVAFAHEKGVVHRDLKPANIMVGRFGEVYVMDWGLAKVVAQSEHSPAGEKGVSRLQIPERTAGRAQTLEGAIFGTPCYMAPEQARGENRRIGPAADIYSIGSILYHLLAGRMPYVEPDAEFIATSVLTQLLSGPPKAIRECNPGVPPELVAICDRAMEREPEQRYASVLAMGEDLQAWLEGRVVSAYETGAFAEVRKWIGRNKGLASAVAGMVLAVLGGSLLFAWQQARQNRQLQAEKELTLQAKLVAEANAGVALRQSYAANLIAADMHLRNNEIREARRRLEACEPSLRGWEWEHVSTKADDSLSVMPHADEVLCVATAPGLARVATGSSDHVIRIWDPIRAELLLEIPQHTGAVRALAFTADGQRLASGSEDGTVRVWDSASGQQLLSLSEHQATVSAVTFDTSGTRLFTSGHDLHVRVWDALTGLQLFQIEVGDQPVETVAVNTDATLLAAGGDDGHVTLWDATDGRPLRELEGHSLKVTGLAFQPGTRALASASMDGSVRVWDIDTGALRLEMPGQLEPVFSLDFDPAGTRLATGRLDGSLRLSDAQSGAVLVVLKGHENPVRSIAFSDDGRHLVSGSSDGTARLWGTELSGALTSFSLDGELVAAVALAPDGQRLAAGSLFTGDIKVWDAPSGALLVEIQGLEDSIVGLAFTPDGSELIAGLESDASIRIFDSRTGTPRGAPLTGPDASLTAIALDPSGSHVYSAFADSRVLPWELATGNALPLLEGHGALVSSLACSADGTRLAAGCMDGSVLVWDTASGELVLEFEAHAEALTTVAFDPAGEILATGSLEAHVRLWDTRSGAPRSTLSGHNGNIQALAFNHDGTRMVSASFDRTLRVWDPESGDPLLVLRAHGGPARGVAIAADGSRIVSSSFDEDLGVVHVFETLTPAERALARRAANLVQGRSKTGASPALVLSEIEREMPGDDAVLAEARRFLEVSAGFSSER